MTDIISELHNRIFDLCEPMLNRTISKKELMERVRRIRIEKSRFDRVIAALGDEVDSLRVEADTYCSLDDELICAEVQV